MNNNEKSILRVIVVLVAIALLDVLIENKSNTMVQVIGSAVISSTATLLLTILKEKKNA